MRGFGLLELGPKSCFLYKIGEGFSSMPKGRLAESFKKNEGRVTKVSGRQAASHLYMKTVRIRT